ncbi:MerR family DNA-binding transcriptional regulator [Streptomyces sp. NPDC048161]|uniref:MerR family DNA-binding transcriptional regulator n=1 Tax=unclassified Streptomyces TaxID=2593676 RepID=UPI0031BB15FE
MPWRRPLVPVRPPVTPETWKVGTLAEASEPTVRTLHHWVRIGLLSPSRRTAAGHREYGEQDVIRLYQVLAPRRLGLGWRPSPRAWTSESTPNGS